MKYKIKTFFITSSVILLGLMHPSAADARDTPHEKPNIIYLMLDDAGYGDFGAFGSPYVQTPHFDRLCSEGMKFTNHYSGSAVCAPTRCVLMTGLHTGHCRRRDNTAKALTKELSETNGRPLVFLEDEDITVAEALHAAGYFTAGVGKWGLGNPGSAGVPENQGFDYWYGYLDQVHAHDHYPAEIWDGGKMVPVMGNKGKKKQTYIPYEQEKKALTLIREHKNEPFFLYLAVTPPHGQYIIPTTDQAFPMYEGIPGGPTVQHYAAMITRTDQMVGKILDLLKELDLDDNTILFYTSDNGPNPPFVKAIDSAGGLRGIKRFLYEGGIRAAMAVRWPGQIPAGNVSDFIWDMRDVFPTLCELGGAKAPQNLDGISVVPTLLGHPQQSRDMHYWEIHSPFQQAVRFGDWKAIRFGTEEPLELYDLKTDPQEKQNIAQNNPFIISKLEAFLATARTESPYFPAKAKKKKK
ncbi:MAG: arylsulfatase [Pirellulales bacterium]